VEKELGGAATYFGLSASYFTDVRVVAVVGEDFGPEQEAVFKNRNIDLRGLQRSTGKTFHWGGEYGENLNEAKTNFTHLNVFESFKPELPAEYRETPFLFLANIDPTLQATVRRQMNGAKLVGGDTMNYWIGDFREDLLKTISEWDFLLINDAEARMLSGEYNLRRAADKILEMGPHTLVIKRGEYGAILWRRDWHFMAPGYLLENVFDPTGAGDCFAGGFMGYLAGQSIDLHSGNADHNELRRAVIYGSVMGSYCCERFGVERFRSLTRADIERRYEEFRQFTSF
jgi:sugar/nucleoside kinase (ribokinase family)